MSTYISIIVMGIILLLYLKKENNIFGESPFYVKINEKYESWYKDNISILNNKHTSILELNKIIYILKKEISKEGITKDDVQDYVNFLEKNKNVKKIGVKSLGIAFLSYFPINTVIMKSIDINFIKNIMEIWKTVIDISIIIITIFIMISVLISVLYQVITSNAKSRYYYREFVMKRIICMWDWVVVEDEKNLEDIPNPIGNKVYINFKSKKFKSDKSVINSDFIDILLVPIMIIKFRFTEFSWLFKLIVMWGINFLLVLGIHKIAGMINNLLMGEKKFDSCTQKIIMLIILIVVIVLLIAIFISLISSQFSKSTDYIIDDKKVIFGGTVERISLKNSCKKRFFCMVNILVIFIPVCFNGSKYYCDKLSYFVVLVVLLYFFNRVYKYLYRIKTNR